MADVDYCEACAELRENVPSLVANGWDDAYCTTMQNDTGLGIGNNDCTDLNTMNDCLVGSMADEAEVTDECEWREYMAEKFIPNLWTLIKAIICAVCGIWTAIHTLENEISNSDCTLTLLNGGVDITVGETGADDSYVVAGKGVSFLTVNSGSAYTSDIELKNYGNFVRITGSVDFRDSAFTDAESCYNFDNGGVIRNTQNRKGNSIWHNTSGTCQNIGSGGELIYEIRIKKSAYPEIASIAPGNGAPTGGGAYQVTYAVFDEGQYAYGQHHRCNTETGVAVGDGDVGHLVEAGWIYIQARMVNISHLNASGTGNKYTPRGWCAITLDPDQIVCE